MRMFRKSRVPGSADDFPGSPIRLNPRTKPRRRTPPRFALRFRLAPPWRRRWRWRAALLGLWGRSVFGGRRRAEILDAAGRRQRAGIAVVDQDRRHRAGRSWRSRRRQLNRPKLMVYGYPLPLFSGLVYDRRWRHAGGSCRWRRLRRDLAGAGVRSVAEVGCGLRFRRRRRCGDRAVGFRR